MGWGWRGGGGEEKEADQRIYAKPPPNTADEVSEDEPTQQAYTEALTFRIHNDRVVEVYKQSDSNLEGNSQVIQPNASLIDVNLRRTTRLTSTCTMPTTAK